jgi:hypothetical protein
MADAADETCGETAAVLPSEVRDVNMFTEGTSAPAEMALLDEPEVEKGK